MNTDDAAIEMIRGRRGRVPNCPAYWEWERGRFYRIRQGRRDIVNYLPERDDWYLLPVEPEPDLGWELPPEEPEPEDEDLRRSEVLNEVIAGLPKSPKEPEPEWEDVPVKPGQNRAYEAEWGKYRLTLNFWLQHPDCLGAIFELPDGTEVVAATPLLYWWEPCWSTTVRTNRWDNMEILRPKALRFRKKGGDCA